MANPERDLLPIAIPHGRSGDTGHLSVYFMPRLLESGPTLAAYTDWKDWPAIVRAMTFTIRVNGSSVAFTQTSAAPSTPKWHAVLPTTTNVAPWFNVDRRPTRVVTYDQSDLASKVGDLYTRMLVEHPTAPPTAAQLLLHPVGGPLLAGGGALSPLPGARDFLEPIPPVPGPPPPVEDPEFHQVLSMLNAHPELLRLLGMVVDFEVTLPAGDPTKVRVSTDWASMPKGAGGTEIAVVMQTTPQFWPKSNPAPAYSEQVAGWAELGDGDWQVNEIDDLTAARRLGSAADTLAGGVGGLPAQESHGISLLRHNNAGTIASEWARKQEIEAAIERYKFASGAAVTLYAEDATIGYRYDAREPTIGVWRSLFQRQADRYKFVNNTSQNYVPAADEGWTTFVLSSEQYEVYFNIPDQGIVTLAKQRITDSMFTWQGWSAAAPRPSKAIDEDGALVVPPVSTADPSVGLEVHYGTVPLTLPRLRYSHTYEFRGRAVFHGGVSRALSEAEAAGTRSPAIKYGRIAPVAPPEIVRRFEKPVPGAGELVDTIVLLGNYDTPPAGVEKQERILLPPGAPQETVELHDLPNGGVDPAQYTNLSNRDKESVATQCVTDAASGELMSDPALGATPPVKFLAEPPAAGAAFTTLPGAAGTTVAVWKGTWPALRGVRFVAISGSGAPVVTNGANGVTVTVKLPKALDLVVDLSSPLRSEFLSHFAYFSAQTAGDQSTLTPDATNGRLWMLGPTRRLRLIHAVRQPLTKSEIAALTAGRPALGSEKVQFDATVDDVDRASTDAVKLTAFYTDDLDVDDGHLPGSEDRTLVLGQFPLDSAVGPVTIAGAEVSFHDQKRHDALVEAEVFSRFARYFTEEVSFAFSPAVRVLDAAGVVRGSVVVRSDATGDAFAVDDDYTIDAGAGTVTRVVGGGIANGAAVTVQFVARPVSRVSTEGGAALFPMPVPASRAPNPLSVREVVPASAFTETTGIDYTERVRTGTILRVYSERGWFGSGNGELLGVVVEAAPGTVPSATRYGRDPLTAGDASPVPVLAQFPRAVSSLAGAAPGLDAAGHAIGYDPSRQLWYTDIEITGLDYRPFVRLSLARFQPLAVAGAHLSRVVDMEPMRVGLNRTTRVTRNVNGSYTIRVTGIEHEGVPNEAAANALMFNTVTVQFQEIDSTITDTDLHWVDVGAPSTLTRTKLGDGTTRWSITRNAPAGTGTAKRVVVVESEPTVRRLGESGVQAAKNEVAIETIELDG